MNQRYKLMAVDMDGTLLTSQKGILPETLKDIRLAAGTGKEIALCTGRGVAEISEFSSILQDVRYAVLNSGAQVYDRFAQKTLYREGIGLKEARKVVEISEKYDAMIQFMTHDATYVRGDQVMHMGDYNMGPYQPMMEKAAIRMEDVAGTLDQVGPPLKMLIYFRTTEDRDRGFEDLKGLPVEMIYQEITSLEITALGVDKGTGLQRLAGFLDLSMDEIIAAGDSGNDVPMLSAAGFAVAVGNASRKIRQMADAVTSDNDHNGVGTAIRKYLIGTSESQKES